jgi:predicted transcriptional regulator
MRKNTITFRVDAKKKKTLDSIAAGMVRDRSFVINEAIDNYLDVYEWQAAHIKEGVRQAKAGKFASDAEVASAFARWRK